MIGSFYLIADVGRVEGLKEIGVHSKRVPAFVLPDTVLQAQGIDPEDGRCFVQRRTSDTWSKMRPDIMIIEMTAQEQRRYLPHDATSSARLPNLAPNMPGSKARQIWIVEGGYYADMRYKEKLEEKEAQHAALTKALKDYDYKVSTLPIILGFSGSHFHTRSASKQIGIKREPVKTVMRKLHEHAVVTLDNIVKSRRELESKRHVRTKWKRTRSRLP